MLSFHLVGYANYIKQALAIASDGRCWRPVPEPDRCCPQVLLPDPDRSGISRNRSLSRAHLCLAVH